jgi:hypothetical protein
MVVVLYFTAGLRTPSVWTLTESDPISTICFGFAWRIMQHKKIASEYEYAGSRRSSGVVVRAGPKRLLVVVLLELMQQCELLGFPQIDSRESPRRRSEET